MIAITGATGKVGRELIKGLLVAGEPVRAVVRDRERAREILGPDVELAIGDFAQPETLDRAFHGVSRVFLAAPIGPQLAELEAAVIDAASRCGVGRVVKLSTIGVDRPPRDAEPRHYPLHRQSEKRLEDSGLAFTHLRPGPFMQNMLQFAPSLAANGVYYGGWGEGRIGWIDVRDIAAVAARVLREEEHAGQAYALTGPETLSHFKVAARLSAAAGRTLRYVDVSPDQARRSMIERGVPPWFAGAMSEVMAHTREGSSDTLTETVRRLTGRAPRSFADFARDFATAFAPPLAST